MSSSLVFSLENKLQFQMKIFFWREHRDLEFPSYNLWRNKTVTS